MRAPLFAVLVPVACLWSAAGWAQTEPDPEPAAPAPAVAPLVKKKAAEPVPVPEAAAAAGNESQVVPLQAREVIERLRTMRAQLLLDEEYNRLLEARVKRLELEQKLEAPGGVKPKKLDAPRNVVGPPPSLEAAADRQLTVKSVTVAPFKEAFVVYKGRTYTVRPGDKLGNLTIRDITENGVVTNGAAVMMEQP